MNWKSENILILNKDMLLFNGNEPTAPYITFDSAFLPLGKWMYRIQKLHYHTCFGGKQMWYSKWKYHIEQYDTVIICEEYFGDDIVRFIHQKNKSCRIIFYYINPVKLPSDPNPYKIKKEICELYSFDKDDCVKYNMKYNPFYYTPMEWVGRDHQTTIDAIFIGADKNRLETLIQLKNDLDDCGMHNEFLILKAKKKKYSKREETYLIDNIISYKEVIMLIKQSKCIVEIVQQGQSGMTLRTMEALFYHKKLITNNKDIVNYEFYCVDNIFILGLDDLKDIKLFIEKPYRKVEENILKYYTYESWIKRFFQ